MEFRRDGVVNNDPRPRFGYLFVDSSTGNVTSLITLVDPFTGQLYYLSSLLTGQYFQVTNPTGRRVVDVISASSGTPGNDFAALQLTGQDRRTFPFRGGSVLLAPTLNGWLMMSASDTESENEEVSPGFTADALVGQLGFVGTYRAEARFQRTASRSFQRLGRSTAEITQFYTQALEDMNIDSGSGPNPGPSPAPTATPSPSPSPTATPVPTATPTS